MKPGRRFLPFAVGLLSFAFFPSVLPAQSFTQRGFLETRLVLYPQAAPGDSGRAVAEEFLRYEPALRLAP